MKDIRIAFHQLLSRIDGRAFSAPVDDMLAKWCYYSVAATNVSLSLRFACIGDGSASGAA